MSPKFAMASYSTARMSSSLTFLLLYFVLAPLSFAQNTSNTTATTNQDTAMGNRSFTSEPRGRGTWDHLFSCSVTFGICVWTAIHPNVIVGASPWDRFYYKATLMVVSIIVPEWLILCAYGQWRKARELHKAWQEQFKADKESKNYLGMDGAFFVVMGGFVVDKAECSNPSDISHPMSEMMGWASKRKSSETSYFTATLTPEGFLNHMKEGRITKKAFEKRAILDKGKASNIAKLLSGFQAAWLVAQCVGSWIAGLPLSLVLPPTNPPTSLD